MSGDQERQGARSGPPAAADASGESRDEGRRARTATVAALTPARPWDREHSGARPRPRPAQTAAGPGALEPARPWSEAENDARTRPPADEPPAPSNPGVVLRDLTAEVDTPAAPQGRPPLRPAGGLRPRPLTPAAGPNGAAARASAPTSAPTPAPVSAPTPAPLGDSDAIPRAAAAEVAAGARVTSDTEAPDTETLDTDADQRRARWRRSRGAPEPMRHARHAAPVGHTQPPPAPGADTELAAPAEPAAESVNDPPAAGPDAKPHRRRLLGWLFARSPEPAREHAPDPSATGPTDAPAPAHDEVPRGAAVPLADEAPVDLVPAEDLQPAESAATGGPTTSAAEPPPSRRGRRGRLRRHGESDEAEADEPFTLPEPDDIVVSAWAQPVEQLRPTRDWTTRRGVPPPVEAPRATAAAAQPAPTEPPPTAPPPMEPPPTAQPPTAAPPEPSPAERPITHEEPSSEQTDVTPPEGPAAPPPTATRSRPRPRPASGPVSSLPAPPSAAPATGSTATVPPPPAAATQRPRPRPRPGGETPQGDSDRDGPRTGKDGAAAAATAAPVGLAALSTGTTGDARPDEALGRYQLPDISRFLEATEPRPDDDEKEPRSSRRRLRLTKRGRGERSDAATGTPAVPGAAATTARPEGVPPPPSGPPTAPGPTAGASSAPPKPAPDTAAGKPVKKSGARAWKSAIRLLIIVGIAVLAAVLLRLFVVQPYYIPSASMEPTLHGCTGCNDDHVLVDKLSYRAHDINVRDIVVFARPKGDSATEKVLIKRVIGVGGDTVALRDGLVYVNGLRLNEPYLNKACGPRPSRPLTTTVKWTVPKGDIFVMGDNRCDSHDSRAFGPIADSSVVGRAFAIIWPIKRFGLLH